VGGTAGHLGEWPGGTMIATVIAQFLRDHWLELAGWSTTLVGIWLTTRRNLLCWPITLAADVLYLVVFYQARLLSDSLLQAFFVAFTLYGWWNWWRGVREEGEVRVVPLPARSLVLALVAGAAGTVLLGFVARRLNASLPYLDAALASYSLVGSWWQARKHIANWWLWIVVNLFYIGEYIYKDLWPTAVLYALLVLLAVVGLRNWRKAPVAVQTPA
jgi:nicotinamide mononucleotide transporter